MFLAVCITAQGQTNKRNVVERGGTGPYKAEYVSDKTLPAHTIYRPQDMKAAVARGGNLPVILYANGACANNNVEMRYLLSEVASHGYVVAAIGPYDEADFITTWRGVMKMMAPKGKRVVLANGEVVKPMTEKERAQMEAQFKAEVEKAKKEGKKPEERRHVTYPKMLIEMLDWLTAQNNDPQSEYYQKLDLSHVAAMGQSCGGAQVLAINSDPRLTTCIILNSGIGQMEMEGCSKENLKTIHTPMLYINGGKEDVAYLNANDDYNAINNVPICMIRTIDGHEGTYYEKHGGGYAKAVIKWLDWRLKDKSAQARMFSDRAYFKQLFPRWSMIKKGY